MKGDVPKSWLNASSPFILAHSTTGTYFAGGTFAVLKLSRFRDPIVVKSLSLW